MSQLSRRSVLRMVAATPLLLSRSDAQFAQTIRWGTAGSDPAIVQSTVTFKSGADTVPALLARPTHLGHAPLVLVIHASWLVEPYVSETVAMLAQAGFVGLAVDLFHFFPPVASWEEARRTQGPSIAKLIDAEFREPRMLRNLQDGISYARSLGVVTAGTVGVLGFCGGGWNALLFGAQSIDVGAVVAYYAPVGLSDKQHRAPLALASYIRMPVQYHGAADDPNASTVDVDRFQALLRRQGTRFERYTYAAAHGFFAYDRMDAFNPVAAATSWDRTVRFVRAHVGHKIVQRTLAPPPLSATLSSSRSAAGAHLALHHH